MSKQFYFKQFSFNVSTVSISKTVPFQIIQFSISTLFKCKNSLIAKNIPIYAIQFSQTIEFSISILFSSI